MVSSGVSSTSVDVRRSFKISTSSHIHNIVAKFYIVSCDSHLVNLQN